MLNQRSKKDTLGIEQVMEYHSAPEPFDTYLEFNDVPA